jgi:hypothetical protein
MAGLSSGTLGRGDHTLTPRLAAVTVERTCCSSKTALACCGSPREDVGKRVDGVLDTILRTLANPSLSNRHWSDETVDVDSQPLQSSLSVRANLNRARVGAGQRLTEKGSESEGMLGVKVHLGYT